MKTKTFINTLVFAILLTFGCSSEFINNDISNNENIGNDNIDQKGHEFTELTFVDADCVIATAWNYILRDVTIDGVRYIQFSDNLGKTFSKVQNTYGNIVYVHFFSNGTVLFATANHCYYFGASDIIDGAITIHESSLVDYDGKPYTSNCILDFFETVHSRNDAMLVGGTEIVAWGNYSLGSPLDPNYVGRMWYSDDYGATVKCAIKFGTTVIDGHAYGVRHTHGVLYNKYKEEFLIITGDYDRPRAGYNDCQLIRGIYTPSTHSWEFHRLGMGDEFKFADIFFSEDFVYLVCDYTVDYLPRGVVRCPYEMLGDYSKYEFIYKIEGLGAGSLITMLEDKNGNKLLFPDGAARGKFWYCKNDFIFRQINLSENVVLSGFTSPNYNGDIYVRKGDPGGTSASFPFWLNPARMINLTKSMRNSGCPDFFVQNNVLL